MLAGDYAIMGVFLCPLRTLAQELSSQTRKLGSGHRGLVHISNAGSEVNI